MGVGKAVSGGLGAATLRCGEVLTAKLMTTSAYRRQPEDVALGYLLKGTCL